MKVSNSLTKTDKKQTFSQAITGQSLQNLIKKSVPDAASAARLTGTLISAVAASTQLQQCNPATIVAAALRGEGQGLALGREYHLVPFGQNCTYVISYKGLIALALATGEIADMDCIEVREGEYIGRDKRTKRMMFDFSVYDTDEEAAKHPVIGYYAYAEMKDGYFRFEYMSMGDILDHAKRFSKSFNLQTYNRLLSGEMTPQESDRIRQTSLWYSATETMFKKTVLRKLLNSGYVRLANSAALTSAMAYDAEQENGILPDLNLDVDDSTGEVVEVENEAAQEAAEMPVSEEKTETKKDTPKRGKSNSGDSGASENASDEMEEFFK